MSTILASGLSTVVISLGECELYHVHVNIVVSVFTCHVKRNCLHLTVLAGSLYAAGKHEWRIM